jgi:hypothetical protein
VWTPESDTGHGTQHHLGGTQRQIRILTKSKRLVNEEFFANPQVEKAEI